MDQNFVNKKREKNREQASQLDEGLDFVKSEVRILRIRVESGGRCL